MESGTIEQSLPGLEGTHSVAPQLAIGRALSLTPQKRLAVVAGSSHPELATKIAGHLGVELTKVERATFADGSPYFRFEDSVRGADMFIVQTAAPSIGEHLMELLIMVNAAKLASAKRITAVIPWYFYARQDKKSRPREPITARLVADLLETAGVDRVITMDLHAGQVQGFFRIPVDHMVAVPMFAQHVRDYLGSEVERVAVAPDTGRAKIRLVDTHSTRYAIARRYMIRLRRDDFDDPHELAKFAATVGISLEDFRQQFGYLVDYEPPPLQVDEGGETDR